MYGFVISPVIYVSATNLSIFYGSLKKLEDIYVFVHDNGDLGQRSPMAGMSTELSPSFVA